MLSNTGEMMKKALFLTLLFFSSKAFAFGLTADQMYRNVLTQENEGALPSYYTVREQAEKKKIISSLLPENAARTQLLPINESVLSPQESAFSEFDLQREWESVIKAVKENRLTPFDLEIIQKRAQNDDAQAIELLAWMYATGKGLKQDLVKSWLYYTQAAHLGVPSGTKNAQAVYKSMTAVQRSQLTAF